MAFGNGNAELRTGVPSFNISIQPISHAATIVRPANLRNLAPDHTLILVNGKRRHRAAVITWLGNRRRFVFGDRPSGRWGKVATARTPRRVRDAGGSALRQPGASLRPAANGVRAPRGSRADALFSPFALCLPYSVDEAPPGSGYRIGSGRDLSVDLLHIQYSQFNDLNLVRHQLRSVVYEAAAQDGVLVNQ